MDTPLDRPAQRYFWSRRIDLKDTWESAMLLCVPIVGSDGSGVRRVRGGAQRAVLPAVLSRGWRESSAPPSPCWLRSRTAVCCCRMDWWGSVNGTYLDGARRRWPSIRDDTITNMTRAPRGTSACMRPYSISKGESGGHRLGRGDPDPPGQLCGIHR